MYITKLMTVSIRAITEFYIENKCNITVILWRFFEEFSIGSISYYHIEAKERYCFYIAVSILVYRENVINCMEKCADSAIFFDMTYFSSLYRK